MKRYFILTALIALTSTVNAMAAARAESPSRGDAETENLDLYHRTEAYDSLLAEWYERNIIDSYESFFRDFIALDSTDTIISDIPDSVYINRLNRIVSPINLGYNDIVKRHIVAYTKTWRGTMSRVLGLSQVYFPMIEEELEKAGLPLELRMVPVIESALNPTAVSRMGATGLWQFMYATGKSYGLEITSFVDQRRDPVLATKAACRFLKDLYNMYNDWTLAIAAYNCGPGNVNKALRRAGENARTFWDIYPYLPNETREYIPAFIGATYAYTYHKQHDIEFTVPQLPLVTDTLMITKMTHFDQVASTLDIPVELLRSLNPQYKLDIIPAVDRPYPLNLPQRDITRFLAFEEEIMAKDSIYLAQYKNKPVSLLAQDVNTGTTVYRVKNGDTLGAIARKHGVTVSQLMKWNNLKNANTLRIGQRIEIHK